MDYKQLKEILFQHECKHSDTHLNVYITFTSFGHSCRPPMPLLFSPKRPAHWREPFGSGSNLSASEQRPWPHKREQGRQTPSLWPGRYHPKNPYPDGKQREIRWRSCHLCGRCYSGKDIFAIEKLLGLLDGRRSPVQGLRSR